MRRVKHRPCSLLGMLVVIITLLASISSSSATYRYGVDVVYSSFCSLFGNTSSLQLYDIDQISSKILSQVGCSKNPTLDCMNCLSSRKLRTANIIGSANVTADDLGRVALVLYCYLNDLNQFCRVDSTPDYTICMSYLTNNTGSINAAMLTTSLGNRIAPIYTAPNEYHPIKGISWDASKRPNYTKKCIDGNYLVAKYKNNNAVAQVKGGSQLNSLFSDIIFMMYNNMKLGCDSPHTNWFIDQLFTKNGVVADSITLQDLSSIMAQMGVVKKSLPNSRALLLKSYALHNTAPLQSGKNGNVQMTSSVYNMNYSQCYNPNQLAQIFSLVTNSISQADFVKLAPSLVYMASSSVCKPSSSSSSLKLEQDTAASATASNQTQPQSSTQVPTSAQKYGYGTIAIVIVSLLALLGIILIPCFGKDVYPKILMILTALAVGTLLSDACLHLIPDILNVGDDGIEDMHIPKYTIFVSSAIGAIWLFWVIETIIHHFAHIERVVTHSHGGMGGDDEDDEGQSQGQKHNHEVAYNERPKTISENLNGTVVLTDSDHHLTEVTSRKARFVNTFRFGRVDVKNIRATGWILLLGDGIHNFADGMAIGASFAVSAKMGIATTIAVVCHEVPHELGNYAVLVKSGFNHCQALIFNLCSALTCLAGFYIGASVSTDPLVSTWIFTITAGMFLYLSLVDLLPQVMHAIKWSWAIFVCCNLAMFFGYGVMLMLVIIEGHINL